MPMDPRKLRSQRLRSVNYQGDALRLGMNWTEEDLAKPQVLVDSAYGMGHPGTFHFRPLIEEASNGAIALRKMTAGRYDLVLSDIRMPLMDGLEFVRRVRQDLADRRTPIVLISTLGTDEDVKRGLEAGATAYILKPLSPHIIKGWLRKFVDDLLAGVARS